MALEGAFTNLWPSGKEITLQTQGRGATCPQETAVSLRVSSSSFRVKVDSDVKRP